MSTIGDQNGEQETRLMAALNMAWVELENGLSVAEIARKYGIEKSSLCSFLVQIDERRYRELVGRNGGRPRVPASLLNQVLARFRQGESLEKLAVEYNVGTITLYRRLPEIIGVDKYRLIVDGNRKKEISGSLLEEAWGRIQSGEQVEKIAEEYKIGYTTLHRKLVQMVGLEKYKETMDRKLNRRIPDPMLTEILHRLSNGEPMTALQDEYGIPRLTLRRRVVQRIGRRKYDDLMEETRPLKRRMPPGYGSPKAKLEGADSLFELEVKRLLEERRVAFDYRKDLNLVGHWYVPDFLVGCTVIEVTGVTLREYWIRYKRKTKAYVKAGYEVIIVTSDRVHKLATKFIRSHGVRVIRYRDFKNNIDDILRAMNAHCE